MIYMSSMTGRGPGRLPNYLNSYRSCIVWLDAGLVPGSGSLLLGMLLAASAGDRVESIACILTRPGRGSAARYVNEMLAAWTV